MADDMTYIPPPKPAMVRRVYVLDRAMVKAIHRVGHKEGIQTEVEIVRMLLADALDRRDRISDPAKVEPADG